ncbi:MAG TPA: hydroxymethylbilane synthase [Solirubrobacteraceae bacterium]|nr:hydroxymethylbilane synthase [Solirubrobacteraceae bacterium]
MRLGTRGSALALAQAEWVAERIGEPVEIVRIATSGDSAAGPGGDKSRWVSALEQALLHGEIDIAVHSAKDVPTELADGCDLIAIPEREDARDGICGAGSLAELPAGARVGTSSLRRAAQLLARRDDLRIVQIRGNVDTRLRKLADGDCDALVLAVAGLRRLGREPDGVLDELVPAAGQGALAVEARAGVELGARLEDADATACVTAERTLVQALGASCDTAVGAHAVPVGDGQLEMSAWVGLPDGGEWIGDRLIGDAADVGAIVAERLLAAGAGELLERAS